MLKSRSWVVWGTATLFVAHQLFISIFFGLAAKDIAGQYSLSMSAVGEISALYALSYGVMQIPAGIFIEKLSIKKIFLVSSCIIALCLIAIGFSKSKLLLYSFSILMGVASSFSFVGTIVLNSRWFPPKMFSIATGLTSGLNGLFASFIGFIVGSSIPVSIKQDKIIYYAIPSLLITALIFFCLKDYPKGFKPQEYKKTGHEFKDLLHGISKSFLNKQILLASFMTAMIYGGMLAFTTFWFFQYQRLYNMSNDTTSLLNMIILIGIAVGAPLFGWISEKTKKRKPICFIICFCLLIMLLLVLQPYKLPHFSLFPIFFLLGFFSNNVSVGFSLVKENSDVRHIGLAISLANTILFLVMSFLQGLSSKIHIIVSHHIDDLTEHIYISKAIASMSISLYIFPAAIILAIILLFFIKETNCKPLKNEIPEQGHLSDTPGTIKYCPQASLLSVGKF